jgi:predicted transport protein/Holliday junction resolvase-like predicted endonuclease
MSILKRYTPQNEKELHTLIQKELDAIEEGLDLLQYEYSSGKGILDFLCADSGGRLVIVEVKLHEDENILFQALRYFSDIDKNRYLIATLFSGKQVNTEESPRIILIAEKFSEDLRRLSTLVVPEVELLEYSSVILPNGDKALVYHSVSLPTVARLPAEPKTIEKLIEYLRNEDLKPLLAKIRHAVKNIGKGIDEYATQAYIGYKHASGRQFAYIKIHRQSIELGAHIIDEKKQLLDYEGELLEDVDSDYSEILQKVKTSFINLGGKVEM